MPEWWTNNTGDNLLKGVEDDDDNLPRLSNTMIYELLLTIQEARDSFNRLYPTMLPDEQLRLDEITVGVVSIHIAEDPQDIEDSFQEGQNKAGVQTAGPKGGVGGLGGGGNGRAGARPPPRGGRGGS